MYAIRSYYEFRSGFLRHGRCFARQGLRQVVGLQFVPLLQQGRDPDQQLFFVEGFGQVGVRAAFQTLEAGFDVGFGREQDDGNMAAVV